MNHHGIVHFEIAGDDPDKLADFYHRLFGWQIDKTDMGGGMAYWTIITGPVDAEGRPSESGYINGGMSQRMSPEQRSSNYVNVESVDEYVEKAGQLGAAVITQKMPVPGMGWFALLQDPQGNQFGVWQTDSSAG